MSYDFRWSPWNLGKIESHGLTTAEVEYVVNDAARPYPKPIGNEKWLVIGSTPRTIMIQVIYLVDADETLFVIHARPLTSKERRAQEKKMKEKKPLAPWLPGKYGRMTRQQLDAESDQYDVEFSATRAKRVANAKIHPKKRGRPRKPADQKAERVLITMAPRLLAAADAAADVRGLTRAGLIRQAVLDWLARQPSRRKTA